MKRLTALFCLWIASYAFANPVYFTSGPALTPDGEKIIFNFEGDLWMVPSAGGTAYRLTGMEGRETNPRVSPDGKWLAFTAEQDGNENVYIMPVEGGKIEQLTYNSGFDRVDSWSWDSQHIYFTSNRYNNFSTYRVAAAGGTPVWLFENFFNTMHHLVEDPNSGGYYFTESWESFRFANRKKYRGDYNPDIKYYDPATKEFRQLTTYRGKDFWPAIDRSGQLYFVSDEANGEYNLYTFLNGQKTQLTFFDNSIKQPQVSANGAKVVFEKDYQIYLFDTATRKSEKVEINLFFNSTLNLPQEFNVKGKITFFDVSPDGKKIAFVSRGELIVSDIEGKFVRQMPTQPEGRVMEVKWLSDNTTLLYNQTVEGWLNWFKINANGKSGEEQLTSERQNNRDLSLSGDREKGVYVSGRNEVRLLDLKTFRSETVVKDEIWGYYNSVPHFSPDNQHLIFTAFRNFEKDIFIYHLQSKTTVNLTNTGVTETDPFWSPDGKYLYFASNRYQPNYPRGSRNQRIYRLPLTKFDQAFKLDRFDSLFVEKKEADADQQKKESKKKPEAASPKMVEIDYDDMINRWEMVSPDAGNQQLPYVTMNEEETTVLYLSDHDSEKYAMWKTVFKPFESPETEKIKNTESPESIICETSSKIYLLAGGNIHELKLKSNEAEQINIDFSFEKSLSPEFNQMFYETWANLQENYYDDAFHGVDWTAVKKHYSAFLPYLNSRANLRTLISDMLGELNSSHLDFRSSGDEEKTFYSLESMQTGLVFEGANPYQVKRIVRNTPLDKADKNIRPGDVLTEVNGQKVDPAKNREFYFMAPSLDSELTLEFKRGENIFQTKVHPQSAGVFKTALYEEWIENNQKRVDEKSSKRIAYTHMKTMNEEDLKNFLIEMTSESMHREALILDLRYNRGGNVHDEVLNFLSQRPYMQWKYRGGEFTPQPNFSPSVKPIVLLVNEQSLSDAELTATGFQALKLGTIIGTETYRWLIFTSNKALVDGSYYRLPSWGCYTLEGEDIELNGVKPDIYIQNTFKDRVEANDPQLDRAIEEILMQLK